MSGARMASGAPALLPTPPPRSDNAPSAQSSRPRGLAIRSESEGQLEAREAVWRRSHARNPNAARGAQNCDCAEMSPAAQGSSLEMN
jgi:hypothetical protein